MSLTTPTPLQRLWFLDWVRILAFGLLVPYHVGMAYVGWDWHIKSQHAGPLLEPWMRLSSPWRMDLLFLVSGAATACMLARAGGASGALLGRRTRRLLLPLAFGMLVVVPPQPWLEVVHKLGYAGSLPEFMRLYLGGYGGFCLSPGQCLVLPTWNHLWFLPYVFVYTLLLWLLLRLWPAALAAAATRMASWLAGARLLWVPVLALALDRWSLRPVFPVTHALLDDWFAHSQYLAMFLLGAVFARMPSVWGRFEQLRWIGLAAALSAWALLVGIVLPAGAGGMPGSLLRPGLYSVQQWCAIAAALGFAHRHLDRDNRVRRVLTEAVFPLYLLHQTVIVVLVHVLAPWQLPALPEGALLVLATFVLGFAGFALALRVLWLRPLMGLAAGSPGQGRQWDVVRPQAHPEVHR